MSGLKKAKDVDKYPLGRPGFWVDRAGYEHAIEGMTPIHRMRAAIMLDRFIDDASRSCIDVEEGEITNPMGLMSLGVFKTKKSELEKDDYGL